MIESDQRQISEVFRGVQLFSKLRRAGLVNSVRGPGGGYMLSRAGDQIRISEIVLAVDTVFGSVASPKDAGFERRNDTRDSLAHDLWTELDGVIARFLESITVRDVCSGRVQGFGDSFANGEKFRAVAE